jgi:type IV pilus assembly protein PilY1
MHTFAAPQRFHRRLTMTSLVRSSLALSVASLVFVAGLVMPPASQADDIEVFFSSDVDVNAKPNVLFVLDTSRSMFIEERQAPAEPYDPDRTYSSGSGGCDPAAYYWTVGSGDLPTCGAGWIPLSFDNFKCPAWKQLVDDGGFFTRDSRVAQLSGSKWIALTGTPVQQGTSAQQQLPTACEGDTDEGGIDWTAKKGNTFTYPINSVTFYRGNWLNWANQETGRAYRIDLIREAVSRVIKNTQGLKVGLMRYGFDGSQKYTEKTRTDTTGTVCEIEPDENGDNVINSLDEASRSSNGAPVVFPVTDLDRTTPLPGFPGADVRAQLYFQLGTDSGAAVLYGLDTEQGFNVNPLETDAQRGFQTVTGGGGTCPIPLFTPGGRTPIGGAMYEAYLYYSGQTVSPKYGENNDFGSTFRYPSVPQSRVGGSGTRYQSPITQSCAKNFIVLLSDGTTEQDNDIDGPIERLPGFYTKLGTTKCDDDPYMSATGTPPPSKCVDDIAEYMRKSDLSTTVDGLNNVVTYTVGFRLGTDAAGNAARNLLRETASRGSGKFFEAGNTVALEDAMGKIVREILTENTSFSAPAVTVNAFNRTQNLNDLYMSLFRPAFNYRWIGNIKRYQLDPIDGDILDALGDPAIDPASGFFKTSSRSFWSGLADGNDIARGGAASKITWNSRSVKTTDNSGDTIELTAAGLDATSLNIGATDYILPGNSGSGALTPTVLLEWFYGRDVQDADGDTSSADSRGDMGDPLHSRPVSVIYGGSASTPDLYDDALFVVTNDGVLHAIDPTNPSNESAAGTEYWSFVPRELTGRIRDLYYNRDLTAPEDRGYGLDGNIRVLRIDNNNNGVIEPSSPQNDKVYLYFGQRRGGSRYFAFDVSTRSSPRLMWSRDYSSTTDGAAGHSWSVPQPAKVRVNSTLTDVLIFGGGYDPDQDQIDYVEDDHGRGIYMVNALSGDVIWRAGPDTGANLRLTEMRHSIPGDVRVIDLTGDGLVDRMYAADLGGRVWRFDIFNGRNPASTTEGDRLVEGGMLATLGNAEDTTHARANTLRFFYSPDPAMVTLGGTTFINVAIGSGHRELPATDTFVQNWFFSVRDHNVLTPLRSSWYKSSCSDATTPCHEIVDETDLVDLTDSVGTTASASVPIGTGGWRIALEETGEKVLAESRTFQGDVYFTTYSPVERGSTDDGCGIKFGLNKLYIVNALDARPVRVADATAESTDDRSSELAQGSISPEVVFIFPTPAMVAYCNAGAGCDPSDPTTWPPPPPNCTGACDPQDPTTWPPVPGPAVPPVCLVGLETCGFGLTNPPVRTYWRQRGVN